MEKDYFKIVMDGYSNPNTRRNLDSYFFRQFKLAEKENFSFEEFFEGCEDVIYHLHQKMQKSMYKRQHDLAIILGWRKNGKRGDRDTPKPLTEQDHKEIKEIRKEYDSLSTKNFPVNLYQYTNNRYQGQLYQADLDVLSVAILKTKNKIQPQKLMPQKPNILPIDFDLNQSELIYLFDILQEAGFLKKPKFQEGSYYRKIEAFFTAKGVTLKDAEQKRNKILDKGLSTSEEIKKALLEAIKIMP